MRRTETDVVCEVERLTVRRLRVFVRRGWVLPAAGERGRPEFDEVDVARVRLVCQLKDDMNLSDEAVPVVLSLIDQLHGTRRELKRLARVLDSQPEDVRRQLLEAYRAAAEE